MGLSDVPASSSLVHGDTSGTAAARLLEDLLPSMFTLCGEGGIKGSAREIESLSIGVDPAMLLALVQYVLDTQRCRRSPARKIAVSRRTFNVLHRREFSLSTVQGEL